MMWDNETTGGTKFVNERVSSGTTTLKNAGYSPQPDGVIDYGQYTQDGTLNMANLAQQVTSLTTMLYEQWADITGLKRELAELRKQVREFRDWAG